MTTPTLQDIAFRLAAALRRMPCTCKRVGEWPIFQREDKAQKCAPCVALEEYDAFTSIVQVPVVVAPELRRAEESEAPTTYIGESVK